MAVDNSDYGDICARCNKTRGEHCSRENYTWCIKDGKVTTNTYLPHEKRSANDPLRHGTLWTATEENEIQRMFKQGFSVTDIATRFQRKPEAVEIRLEKLGHAEFNGALKAFETRIHHHITSKSLGKPPKRATPNVGRRRLLLV